MPNPEHRLPPHTGVILVAAGTGSRFGQDKMWVSLHGAPLIRWSLKTCLDAGPAALVLVHSGDSAPFAALDARDYRCVAGGATRRQSVLAGLAALPAEIDQLLIHDAARPGLPPSLLHQIRAALSTAKAALPTLPLQDTIRQIRPSCTLDRSNLCAAQTPQGFDRAVLEAALASSAHDQSDEIQAVEALGHAPSLIRGSAANRKVTHPQDLDLVAALMRPQRISLTGLGFDVHRFCRPGEHPGRELVLGGLPIPGAPPLAGHSDADVLLHALCDAIYGALGNGDIGQHFPPSEAQWRDQDSSLFLSHALGQVQARGGSLIHMDTTLICETPKLAPWSGPMKQRLAALTHLPPERIGLKATTTEGLGFAGRKEGIAAQAVVTLELPA